MHVSAVDMQARVRGAAGRSSYVAVLRCCSSLVCGLVGGLVGGLVIGLVGDLVIG